MTKYFRMDRGFGLSVCLSKCVSVRCSISTCSNLYTCLKKMNKTKDNKNLAFFTDSLSCYQGLRGRPRHRFSLRNYIHVAELHLKRDRKKLRTPLRLIGFLSINKNTKVLQIYSVISFILL